MDADADLKKNRRIRRKRVEGEVGTVCYVCVKEKVYLYGHDVYSYYMYMYIYIIAQ